MLDAGAKRKTNWWVRVENVTVSTRSLRQRCHKYTVDKKESCRKKPEHLQEEK